MTKAADEMLDFGLEDKASTKRRRRRRTIKPKRAPRATKNTPDDELTPTQLYHRKYYQERADSRAEAHRARWERDEEYRQREIERQRAKRQEAREEAAPKRFARSVSAKRKAAKPTRRPKYVEVDGERCYVYGTGTFARELGKEDATIRVWLKSGILPGCTIWIGKRAHFSETFMRAVRQAVKELYTIDGRGNLDVLKRLVVEQFKADGVSFVTEPGGERQQA